MSSMPRAARKNLPGRLCWKHKQQDSCWTECLLVLSETRGHVAALVFHAMVYAKEISPEWRPLP